ncbi:precorrin-8X methylmutase [Fusibacter bizertensis]
MMNLEYIRKPMAIETKSFEIIDEIIKNEGLSYPSELPLYKAIYQRVIHTSADFDYLDNLVIDEAFITQFKSGLSRPVTVYTDTKMALSGINKTAFDKIPWTLKCLISDEHTAQLATELGITRSMAAVQIALQTPGEKLFVIGNAPTAIYQLLESTEAQLNEVIGVIGIPVGFVGAAESKALLNEHALPSIVALGRKGGSNVAATIVNALLYHLVGRNL